MQNPDIPEITNHKHQITNKFQITISKSQIRPKADCFEFGHCDLPFDLAQGGVSLSNHLVFVFWYLKFFITET
jgi:hypothetical protein